MLHQIEQVGDVAEALRHLLALGIDHEPVVHPVVREALAQRHGLGTLVLVMRELEVHAAAVQVEPLAEEVEAHHDALAVPARPAVAPRRRPRRLARLGQLPQDEVGRMTLVLGAEHLAVAAAFDHVGEMLVDEQSVVLDRLDIEVHAVVGGVAAADLDELADHRHHLFDVRGGVRHVGGPRNTELAHRLEPHRLALGRDVLPRPVLVVGAVDDGVVDVGDVADQSNLRGRSTRGSDAARRRPALPDRGRGAAGRTRWGRTGRCSPCRARARRAHVPLGWRCRTGAAWPASLRVGDREPPDEFAVEVEGGDRADDDRRRRLDHGVGEL